MPIKKKLPTPSPVAQKSPQPKAAQRVAPAAKKPAPVAASNAPRKPTEMGPPMDPATLPGANESAPSLAGQRYSIKYSTTSGVSVWVFEAGSTNSESYWCWRQCGAAVVFEYKTARYIGRFEGDTLKGTASNTSGVTWEWSGTLAAPNASGMQCFHSPL
jgi:hypothetical protein